MSSAMDAARRFAKSLSTRFEFLKVGSSNDSVREQFVRGALAAIPAGSRILDAGAGELRFRKFCEHLDYLSQDFDKYDGVGNGQGLQTGGWDQSRIDFRCDITAIPQPDRSFDAVLCTEVIEHIPDPLAAFREFARLLRPTGTLILTAPFCSLTHFAPYHFYSGFNSYFYRYHLPRLGFRVKTLAPNGNFFEFVAQELRRLHTVSSRYAAPAEREGDRLAVAVALKALSRLAKADSGSSELLCFGYGVIAERLVDPA